ncbi:MAG: bifunctional [glutamate--ammonia ligase]-adenylyl-L-tyrosine phosphorylase/[glutamate--ammonia-ligase] adenylyltransferase [Nitrospiraceae bacterium]|nr:MAG: bifunctional [glutamate--ammonia ligase]-adenylyl-L-tyrosine phosphorylase/[glutamate--ammonia-ligase] adenylyltransferase [Nitrospiraceae bacterium]
MTIDKEYLKIITDSVHFVPDPARAERNLIRFFEGNTVRSISPDYVNIMAHLFSVSQFLANYCMSHPVELEHALDEMTHDITPSFLLKRSENELNLHIITEISDIMKAFRLFKKRYLLRITLRDISEKTDIRSSMQELTALAETLISAALECSLYLNKKKFGSPSDSRISLIALGKLGGEELNYSSDVDLIAVYDNDQGQTTGIPNPSGLMYNKISNHEFYCKTVELFSRILSSQTEDGIAYRTDLRLRPQGQKGDIAMPLKSYRTYYESWGRTWERMALIRARPVAGDSRLGQEFIESVDPFVWRKTSDFTAIEEIRILKKQIDSTFTKDDIKRGYGGIREAEFFIQTFQLLYGGENIALKSSCMFDAVNALTLMNIVPEREMDVLWENYLYYRRIEHFLQMTEDLQTHTLPSDKEGISILARKMKFDNAEEFTANLGLRRMQIKKMYNSLLGTREDAYTEALNLLEGKMTDRELGEYLKFRNVTDPEKCLVNLKSIREHMADFRTMQERKITREVMPQLFESAMAAESPDRAMAGLEKLLTTYGLKPAHLSALHEHKELIQGIIKIFSLSPYLTRIFLSNQQYLNILIEEWSILKSLEQIEERLGRAIERSDDFPKTLAEFKRFEEFRLGILFLLNILTLEDLFKGMSHLAEAIMRSILQNLDSKELSVIALGKLGGQEMTFGSDLDIVFVSSSDRAMTAAVKAVRILTSYTDAGQFYSVDTRLRPDGSKGVLVKKINGYRNYYLKKAQKWEIQALLKARPVAGDENLGNTFMNMARDVILTRGSDITKKDIADMRLRIMRELSNESEGLDIKLGPGGIEEIEFYVQYLELHNAREFPEILQQNTLSAIDTLTQKGLFTDNEKTDLVNAYTYYRKLETFLRLNEEHLISRHSPVSLLSEKFMGHLSTDELISHMSMLRENVISIFKPDVSD